MKKLLILLVILVISLATVDYTKAETALQEWNTQKALIASIQLKADTVIQELAAIIQEQSKKEEVKEGE